MPLRIPYRLGDAAFVAPIDPSVEFLRAPVGPVRFIPTPAIPIAGPFVPVQPTSDGQTPISNLPGQGTTSSTTSGGSTVVVTPTGGPIPPPTTPMVPATAAAAATTADPFTAFFTGSLFGGIPNWVLFGGAALLLLGGRKR